MDGDLRIYILLRTDIEIPTGKLLAQAAHAAVYAYRGCLEQTPDLIEEYDRTQTKICLKAKNIDALTRAQEECEEKGIPAYLVKDAGRTVFDEPTITALGIGPVKKENLPNFVQHLRLY